MIDGDAGRRLGTDEEADAGEDLGLATESFVRASDRQKEARPRSEGDGAEQRNAIGLRRVAHVRRAPLQCEAGTRRQKRHEYARVMKRPVGLPPQGEIRVVASERANKPTETEAAGQIAISELSGLSFGAAIVAERRGEIDVAEPRPPAHRRTAGDQISRGFESSPRRQRIGDAETVECQQRGIAVVEAGRSESLAEKSGRVHVLSNPLRQHLGRVVVRLPGNLLPAEDIADHDLGVARAGRCRNVRQFERPGRNFLLGDQSAVDVDLDARRGQRRPAEVQRRIADEIGIEIEIAGHRDAAHQHGSAEEIGRRVGVTDRPASQALALIDRVVAQ